MTLKKFLPFVILIVLVSCIKEKPKIIWTYRLGDLDMLYGNVKEIIVRSDSHIADNDSTIFYIGKDGKQKQLDVYFHGNHWKYRYISSYDEATKRLKAIEYESNLTPVPADFKISHDERMRGTLSYDDKDRIIKYTGRLGDEKCIYKFNNAGDLVESHQNLLRPSLSKTSFKYDNHHLMIESIESGQGNAPREKYSTFKEVLAYKYKSFDSHNNWLNQIIHFDDGKNVTITRKITYY